MMYRRALTTLSLFALGAFFSCATEDSETTSNAAQAVVASYSGNPAFGPNVALDLAPGAGCFYAFKSAPGAVFTSSGPAPHLELYVDGVYRDYEAYQAGDAVVIFDVCAIDMSLALGTHHAELRAFPDMVFPVDDLEWFDCWSELHNAVEICTKSPQLEFFMIPVFEPPTEVQLGALLDGNCGNGNGSDKKGNQGKSEHACTGWIDIGKGTYAFDWLCAANSNGRVTLNTKKAKDTKKPGTLTTIKVREPGGKVFVAPLSIAEVDHVEYEATQTGGCRAIVEVLDETHIKLQVQGGFDSGSCVGQVPEYDCPPLESLVKDSPDWCSWPADSGAYDHLGTCYREIVTAGPLHPGQQCCYGADGIDNCTGTYDKVGPANGEESDGTCKFDIIEACEHCNADVRPFCDEHCGVQFCSGPGGCGSVVKRTDCGFGCTWVANDCGGVRGDGSTWGPVDGCNCGKWDAACPQLPSPVP